MHLMSIITQTLTMSRQSLPLSDFLASLLKFPSFPKQQLLDYLNRSSPSKNQCLEALKDGMNKYQRDCFQYRQAAVAIWICGIKNLREGIEVSLDFFESLASFRLLMLVFDRENNFALDGVLLYLQDPLEVTTRKALQFQMADRLMAMIKSINQSNSKYNEILFLMEFLLVKKIKKNLDESSQQEFMSFLKETLLAIKMDRIQQKTESLRFRYSALLREHEDSSDTYHLTFKDARLVKELEKTSLPHWILEAFMRCPKPLDLTPYRSRNVIDVLLFMSQAEVYASSPRVDDLEQLIQDQRFQQLFESFLLGQQMGSGNYKFGCQTAWQTISILKERLAKENPSYRSSIVREAMIDYEDKRAAR